MYGITCVAFAFLADLIGTGVLQVQIIYLILDGQKSPQKGQKCIFPPPLQDIARKNPAGGNNSNTYYFLPLSVSSKDSKFSQFLFFNILFGTGDLLN